MPRRSNARRGPPGSVRIIAGEWRGRRIPIVDEADVRPTPDRVRETVFNWLREPLVGARCLDLFAGTGALGFEALSRGAAEVAFCESAARVAAELRATLDRFGLAATARVIGQPAEQALKQLQGPFDVAFLDPPFDAGLLAPALHALARQGLLAADAAVYVEMPAREALPPLPAGWRQHREGKAGEVGYHLLTAAATAAPTESP